MKTKYILQIAILICITLVIGCSKDDSNDYDYSSININPPNWIHGTWLNDSLGFGYELTSNDIISIFIGYPNDRRSERERLQGRIEGGCDIRVFNVVSNDSVYGLSIYTCGTWGGFDFGNHWYFEKVSNNKIKQNAPPPNQHDEWVFTKQ